MSCAFCGRASACSGSPNVLAYFLAWMHLGTSQVPHLADERDCSPDDTRDTGGEG